MNEVLDHAMSSPRRLEEEDDDDVALLLVGSPQEVDALLGDARGLHDGDGHPGLTPGLASLLKGLS